MLLGQFGINYEKVRTIRSAPKADSEVSSLELKIESSVQENWIAKLKEVVQKNKGKSIKAFAFFTTQDIGTKQIKIDDMNIDVERYCNTQLGCEQSYVVGQKDLVLPMQNPKYFNIRRNCLGLSDDFFCSVSEYNEILKHPPLKCEAEESALQRYGIILKDKLSFDHSRVLLLHNSDYLTLLHTVGVWALNLYKEDLKDTDFCFIKWPYKSANVASVDSNEVDKKIQTFLVIWGAHEIDNLSDFLRFAAANVTIVLVTLTGFREAVRSRLESLRGGIRVEEVCVEAIDERLVRPEDKAKHLEKIRIVVQELLDLMLRYEALVYFYSPFNLDDQHKINKIIAILDINLGELDQLRELIIKCDLAAITGRILWLKQPIVAKELLNDFINKDIISISSLLMEI
jgi:hypothetical protein